MVRTYPPTTGPPSAFACRATWATKTPNIFPESSSQTAGTITVKAAVLGMEAFEAERRDHSRRRPAAFYRFSREAEQKRCVRQIGGGKPPLSAPLKNPETKQKFFVLE